VDVVNKSIDFHEKVERQYPKLNEHLFPNVFSKLNYHGGAAILVEFIREHKIPPSGRRSYTTYEDAWNYIVENEHLHEWWML